ncbi:MAG TPA: zinc-ribbon domain-containing protein [Pyrinomonadaceae bacterium]|nr:zinc-ribbon domain-containing protein [Pyrinomonadaceae bacterium]
MIVTCHNCATRLQLDDSKVPTRAFSVRCPKCQQLINAQGPQEPAPRDALGAVGDVPPSGRTQREAASTPFVPPPPVTKAPPAPPRGAEEPEDELLRALVSLLRRAGSEESGGRRSPSGRRGGWEPRRVLVCASQSYVGELKRVLADDGYDVFYQVLVAADAAKATDLMREERVDVIVLDPEFDMGRQGAAQVARELATMRMPERRRVVLVHLTPSARTGDAHAAFLAGANLVVNTSEVRTLPGALEKNIQDLNELYRDFNRALGVAEL